MLEKGVIPRTEPLLRVGIILPEDKAESLTIQLQPQQKYLIKADDETFSQNEKIVVTLADGTLEINGVKARKLLVKALSENGFATASPVIAGRGFHWFKYIDVKLPETIEVTVQDGALMLVNELKLETYLTCVATSEMGAACPPALIEAQTVVARAWMLANVEQKHIHLGFDVCNDDCCQRYQGFNNVTEQSHAGALATKGMVITYNGAICDARYSKCCGGMMETFENLWENTPLPYMQAIPDMPEGNPYHGLDLTNETNAREWILTSPKDAFCGPETIPSADLKKYLGHVDEAGEYYRWNVTISHDDLAQNIREKAAPDLKKILDIEISKRAASGRSLEMDIRYLAENDEEKVLIVAKDYEARRLLHPKFLYSSAVVIEKKMSADGKGLEFHYRGAGWGHGAGLCQIGALGMSLKGYTTEQILKHYYPGVTYEKIYD
jgi:stage II sporulation protein D